MRTGLSACLTAALLAGGLAAQAAEAFASVELPVLLSFAAAALIDDFGMELVGLETPTYDADAQVDIEYLNDIHKNFVVQTYYQNQHFYKILNMK